MNKKTTMTYFDVIEACGEAGCPLCRINRRTSESYIDSILYEMVNDPKVRSDFAAARGYCNRHAWMMPQGNGRSLNVALMQKTALAAALEVLDKANYHHTPGHRLRRMFSGTAPSPATRELVAALEPQIDCAVCQREIEMQFLALNALLDHLHDPDMLHAFEQSSGLCLPHFRAALSVVRDEGIYSQLVKLQRTHLERLRDELAEFIRKNDYQHAGEGFGAEGNSWLRAIGIVSGEK